MIGNREVEVTASTSYLPDDFSQLDIIVGAKIEAEGTYANGVLTADKISFRRNVKLESDVATINGNTFTLVGLPGIQVSTNSETTADPFIVGSHVEVRGIEGPGNTVLATLIRDRSGSDAFLQGAVDAESGTQITILGVSVDTSIIPQFQDINENLITSEQFLDLVELGTLVKVKGTLSGPNITYEEAELED